MITVYKKPNCMQCAYAVKYLEKNNIEFNTIDVTQDEEALNYIKYVLGYQAVPVVVSSTEHWYGFQPDKLAKLVG